MGIVGRMARDNIEADRFAAGVGTLTRHARLTIGIVGKTTGRRVIKVVVNERNFAFDRRL